MAELAEINMKNMQENSAQAADLLKAMSNQHRLLLLCYLGEKEMSVTELNNVIELSQSSLSQHLARLRQDGLVKTRRESQTIFYSIANPSVVKLISFLHSEFCQSS